MRGRKPNPDLKLLSGSRRFVPNDPIGSAPDYDRCVFDGEWKLRRVPTGDELYDVLGEDDGPNVADANPDEVARLQAIMSAIGG